MLVLDYSERTSAVSSSASSKHRHAGVLCHLYIYGYVEYRTSNIAYNTGWLIMMLPDSPSCGSEGNAAVERDALLRRQLAMFLLPFVSTTSVATSHAHRAIRREGIWCYDLGVYAHVSCPDDQCKVEPCIRINACPRLLNTNNRING